MYIINFDIRHSERDNYETGCDPSTAQSTSVDIRGEAQSLKELLEAIENYFGVNDGNILLDACDEKGRIDVQVYEYADGSNAEDATNDPDSNMGKAWREGKLKIWLVTYTGTAYIEELEKISLTEYTK